VWKEILTSAEERRRWYFRKSQPRDGLAQPEGTPKIKAGNPREPYAVDVGVLKGQILMEEDWNLKRCPWVGGKIVPLGVNRHVS